MAKLFMLLFYRSYVTRIIKVNIPQLKAMFNWSENREDRKLRRENRRDFRWKGCLIGVIMN